MNNAFFCGFVYCRLCLSHQFIFGVSTRFLGGTQIFFQVFKFLCRFMVGQLGLAPCISELKIKIKPYFKNDNIYLNLNFVKEKV